MSARQRATKRANRPKANPPGRSPTNYRDLGGEPSDRRERALESMGFDPLGPDTEPESFPDDLLDPDADGAEGVTEETVETERGRGRRLGA